MVDSGLPPPSSREGFEIAIICTLAAEYDAVSLLIDRFWDEDGDKYGRAIGDQNTYTTGRMGSFDIVVVLLPNTGKVSAAMGICGGVPYTKDNEEILLGDVVISKTVIQYDLGRQHSGQFLTKSTIEGRLGRPGPNIRNLITIMETSHGRERLEYRAAVLLEQLQRHSKKRKSRKPATYEYPGILKDRLFETSYPHKHHHALLSLNCCEEMPCDLSHMLSCDDLGCDDEHVIHRRRLNQQAQNLSVFIGRFGSGDTLLTSGKYRDQLAQRHELLAFEMEGAGVWDELPCVIVKGISNYADGHWNADSAWQRFAAATAAATARALIERYPKTDKSNSQLAAIKSRKRTEAEEECLRDMHMTDPSLDKKRIEDTNGGLLRDSYVWILSNADFMRWRSNPDSGLLWIKGDPGKGKTMLLCGLIDEIQSDLVAQPYYFFCQASNSRLNSAAKILCSLVYSIACQDHEALSYVMEKYRHTGKELFYNYNSWIAMSQILTNILRKTNMKNKVFIVDALDECVTDLSLLLDFISQASGLSEAKWIVSSRNWSNIEEKLNRSSKKLLLSLELNEQSISESVRIYIEHKVTQLTTLKELDEPSRNAVQTHLSNNANGTFLWVALVCKELFKDGVKKRHLQDLLTAFPPDLGPLYRRMLTHVCDSQDADVCVQVLELMSLIYRPILLAELASFVTTPRNDADNSELRDVIATCGSFLVVKDDVVYFVHQSAKDFLLDDSSNQSFPGGIARKHQDIFSRSVQILSQALRQDIYDLRHPGAIKSEASAFNPDPLALIQYACLYWVDHLRDSGSGCIEKNISLSAHQEEGVVYSFLKTHLLHWLEALSLMGRLSEGIMAIRTLELLTAQDIGPLHMFIQDARRFVLSFRQAVEHTPLQLYSSALIFAPTSSIVRQTFEPIHTAPWIAKRPSVKSKWDACLQILEGHEDRVLSVQFSPDGTTLASTSLDKTLRIWDRATGACLQTVTSIIDKDARSVLFSPGGSQIALPIIWERDREGIKMLDQKTGKHLPTLYHNMELVGGRTKTAFSLNGTHLIQSNEFWEDAKFRIWDLTTGMQLRKEDYCQDVEKLAVFRTENNLGDTVTNVRSPITGSCVQIISQSPPSAAEFSPDGAKVALVMSPRVYIVDATTGECLRGWYKWITALAFSPDGTQLAMGDDISGNIDIWDIETGTRICSFSGHSGKVHSLAFSPDGNEVASAADGPTIRIWALALGTHEPPEKTTNNQPLPYYREARNACLAYSPDSTRIALVRGHFTIEIWDSITEIRLQVLQFNKGNQQVDILSPSTRIAFSPDNTQLAVVQSRIDHPFSIWDIATNTLQHELEVNLIQEKTVSLTFSPDGTRLAQVIVDKGNLDHTIKIWDIVKKTAVHTFTSIYRKKVTAVSFSLDGRCLGSAGYDQFGVVYIWDLNTGTCLQEFNIKVKTNFQLNLEDVLGLQSLRQAQSQSFAANMLHNQDLVSDATYDFDLSSNTSWLLRRGEPILWLPPEYRPTDMAFSGGCVALKLHNGRNLLFCFHLEKLDPEMLFNASEILKI